MPPFYDPKAPKSEPEIRDILALIQFRDDTNHFRLKARREFANIATFQSGDALTQEYFYRTLKKSKFVVSPPGEK